MFTMLDTDRNGYISFRDFLHMVVIFSKGIFFNNKQLCMRILLHGHEFKINNYILITNKSDSLTVKNHAFMQFLWMVCFRILSRKITNNIWNVWRGRKRDSSEGRPIKTLQVEFFFMWKIFFVAKRLFSMHMYHKIISPALSCLGTCIRITLHNIFTF